MLAVLEPLDENGDQLPTSPSFTSASGTQYSSDGVLKSFVDISTKLDINGAQGKFESITYFTLAPDSNGIDPQSEDMSLQLGPFSITIPARDVSNGSEGSIQI